MRALVKVKNFFNRNKIAVAVSSVTAALSVVAMNVFAAVSPADTSGVKTALSDGFQTCVNDIIDYAIAIVPIALAAFGVTFAITKCVSFFKKVTGGSR